MKLDPKNSRLFMRRTTIGGGRPGDSAPRIVPLPLQRETLPCSTPTSSRPSRPPTELFHTHTLQARHRYSPLSNTSRFFRGTQDVRSIDSGCQSAGAATSHQTVTRPSNRQHDYLIYVLTPYLHPSGYSRALLPHLPHQARVRRPCLISRWHPRRSETA